ncbi:bifunctional metallophosphatase/5'-nucleotidase [Actinomadura chibensis]|uniref:Bifunctional metallophosphatase/5'-nucleotidase n=1 Tax=Actinomadura chibensis TaxID=392828 RepID=A0A5D0N942_9ACTN|nr:bifunctional metallophosphatase/5'-nucleotidase [Actinomadura chibensis]TYB40846.1 bifunctional metallophosphatase/5'-nucleotidase [Actinomadura chibensis]
MTRRRTILACATAALTVAGLTAQPAAARPAPTASGYFWGDDPPGPPAASVRLLALNDFHGNLEPPTGSSGRAVDENGNTVDAGGAAYVAAHIKRLQNRDTLTVAQGDLIGASPLISAAYHDEPSVKFLGDIGVTASAVGNHEFDEGYRELLRIQNGGCHPVDGCTPDGTWRGAKYDYLAANVLKRDRPILKPWTIRRVNGVRVGFIGVVTKTTPSIVTAEGIKGLTFDDEVAAANRSARELKRRGVRAIVLLVHEGDQVKSGSRPDECGIVPGAGSRIAKDADPEIDVVLSGHTHQQYICSVPDPKGRPRLFSSGSSFGRVITEVNLKVDRRTGDVVRSSLQGDNHVVTRDVPPDPATQAFVKTWQDRVAAIANKPIGRITADLTRAPSPAGETALGDVIADAQLAGTKDLGGQIALMNPGGVRTDLTFKASGSEGDGVVTYGEAFAVQPFSNVMGVTSLTGAQLDALLEQQWTSAGEKILQPSANLHFTIDRTKPVGDRVSAITVDGTPVTPAAVYKVAANNFLLGGGDGFSVFTEGKDQVLGQIDLDTLVAYFQAQGTITPPPLTRITTQ